MTDGFLAFLESHHPLGVFKVPVGDDAFQIVAGQGDDEGVGPGGKDEGVIGDGRAILRR